MGHPLTTSKQTGNGRRYNIVYVGNKDRYDSDFEIPVKRYLLWMRIILWNGLNISSKK